MLPSAELGSFAVALVDAFIAGGKKKPVLPHGRRQEYVALLTRLMGSRELLDAYCEALDAERRRQGAHRALLALPGEEIPEQEIAAHGFANLSDDELADLALNGSALRAISGHLFEKPEVVPGDWLADALLLDLRLRANVSGENDIPGWETVSRLVNKPLWEADELNALDTADDAMNWGLGEDEDDEEEPGTSRLELTVTNESDARAFVTVVGPGPTHAPTFYHDGERYLEVPARGEIVLRDLQRHLGPKVHAALVVLTAVPAGDPVSRSLPRDVSPESAEQLAAHLTSALETLGIQAVVRVAPVRFVNRAVRREGGDAASASSTPDVP